MRGDCCSGCSEPPPKHHSQQEQEDATSLGLGLLASGPLPGNQPFPVGPTGQEGNPGVGPSMAALPPLPSPWSRPSWCLKPSQFPPDLEQNPNSSLWPVGSPLLWTQTLPVWWPGLVQGKAVKPGGFNVFSEHGERQEGGRGPVWKGASVGGALAQGR